MMDNKTMLLFMIWLETTDGFLRVGVSNACYGQGPCSRHDLACGGSSRLAIISAVHGFKRKDSLCPSLAINHCNFNTKFCCREDTVFDCVLPFKDVYIRTLYEGCSGHRNCTYYTDRVQEVCALSTKTLSTFSSIRFSCVRDSDVVQFNTEGSARGRSVFAVFDPERFDHVPDPILYYSCRVEPEEGDESVNVTINALDVRLDRTTRGPCSSLTVRDKGGVVTNVTCGQYYKRTFLNSVHSMDTVSTPLDLVLKVVEKNMPGYVWLHVHNDDVDLRLSCRYLDNGWWDYDNPSSSRALSSGDSSGAVAGCVVLVILLAGALALVLWWKRRAKVTKYLQTIPISATCSKDVVERRLRAQSGCSEYNLTVQLPEESDKSVTLLVRPSGSSTEEPIYDRIKLGDNKLPVVSAVGVYDHLRHEMVDKHKEGYDRCAVGMVRVDKDVSNYDTPESASRQSDDVKRNISYDHLNGKISVTDPNFTNPDCCSQYNDDDYEPTEY